MTDFDERLIEKANELSIWDYRKIDVMIFIADTKEAKGRLLCIRESLNNLVLETI